MVSYCNNLPFSDLGFIPYDENMWVKFTCDSVSIPQFAISTTINPKSQTFVIKHLPSNKTMSFESYDLVKEFVISQDREDRLKKLLD